MSEAAAGTTTNASPEAQWLVERLFGAEEFESSKGRRGINLYYARLGWVDSVLQWWRISRRKGELEQIERK